MEKDQSRSPGPVARAGRFGRQGVRRDGQVCERDQPVSRASSETRRPARRSAKFDAAQPLQVKLADGERWVKPSRLQGSAGDRSAGSGLASARPSPRSTPTATVDSTCFWRPPWSDRRAFTTPCSSNKGEGRFEDASASFGLPADRASLGVAAADFDADRHIDLFLTGVGDNRLLRNRDGKAFEDVSSILKPTGPPAVSLMARWLDLDQDGDLDLYVVNYCAAEHADKAFLGTGRSAARDRQHRLSQRRPARSGVGLDRAKPDARRHGLWQAAGRQGFDPGPHALDRRAGALQAGSGPTRASPCSISTTTATSTWC